jgi:hypothetical protein
MLPQLMSVPAQEGLAGVVNSLAGLRRHTGVALQMRGKARPIMCKKDAQERIDCVRACVGELGF